MSKVLIVGASPTGLALALELKRREIDVRLIDKREAPLHNSKALGIQTRTLELFEKLDVLDDFLKTGLRVDSAAYHWNKKTISLSFNELNPLYPFILIIPQSQTEERAPNVSLGNAKQLFQFLRSRKHVILSFKNKSELQKGLIQEYGEWIEIFVVEGEEIKNIYEVGSNSLYIIRSDGYIGYRSRFLKVEEVISYLFQVFKPVMQRGSI